MTNPCLTRLPIPKNCRIKFPAPFLQIGTVATQRRRGSEVRKRFGRYCTGLGRLNEEGDLSFLAWIVLGLIAGFIESNLVNKRGKGIVLDILLGIAAR